jgi:competence protein ComEC
VYDSGPRYGPESDAGHRVLVPLLRAFDEHVDMLMLSHRDGDHTGGAATVLQMQPQAALVSSIEDGHPLQSMRHGTRCTAGVHWSWDGVDFAVLHPQAGDYDAPAKSNAMSCVLRISNGQHTVLLAGDLESPQEARLVEAQAPIAADLLLVPHHGSKTSSSAAFLDAVHPAWALVQAGYRNRFGHPAPPVMDRYHERGIRVVDSPHCGAARWSSVQPERIDCEREIAPRYWLHRVP